MHRLLVCLLLLLAGCWTWGNAFTREQVSQLKPGMTIQEVEAIMGPADSVAAGTTTRAMWVYATAMGGVHSLNLVFGPDGRLTAVPGKQPAPPTGPTFQQQAAKVTTKMSLAEVTTLLGQPSHVAAGVPVVDPATGAVSSQTVATWVAPAGAQTITLIFGADGRVTSVPSAATH